MPENEKPVNIHWLVGVPGVAEPLVVWAAYVQTHHAANLTTTGYHQGADLIMTTLKDADHKIVFQAPAMALNYVRRDQPGIKREGGKWTVPAGDAETDLLVKQVQSGLISADEALEEFRQRLEPGTGPEGA